MGLHKWIAAVAVAGNQLLNALSGGSPDESISSRLGHAREHGSKFARAACAVLEKVNTGHPQYPDHCLEAMAAHDERMRLELERRQR